MNSVEPIERPQHLLLVDDEDNVLRSLTRALRRDGYQLHTAHSASEALDVLKHHPIDVILSDQRMPEQNGTEFLSQVKTLYPQTVRLMLSGYTEVGSVTDAINEGSIYKFLTKPWDDDQLRANIREAFHRHHIETQNLLLQREVEEVNAELLQLNHTLEQELQDRNLRIERDTSVACVMQEMMDLLPLGILGVDQDAEIVWSNALAGQLLGLQEGELIAQTLDVLPLPLKDAIDDHLFDPQPQCSACTLDFGHGPVRVELKPMGGKSRSSGCLVLLTPSQRSAS